MRFYTLLAICALSIISFSCRSRTFIRGNVPVYTCKIIDRFPHDKNAYTEGIEFENGFLYEGTGRRGDSSLRKIALKTGKIKKTYLLPDNYYGEGITIFEDKIFQLTWKSNIGFIYDKDTFALTDTFENPFECWGLTSNKTSLILSDGSETLYFLDPESLEITREIIVHTLDGPIQNLNEIEYVKGYIYANIWGENYIAIIKPENGYVEGWIDLTGLINDTAINRPVETLNGIAYDSKKDHLFVTAKYHPTIYEIELIPLPLHLLGFFL